MKKQFLRVTLFSNSTQLCNDLVIAAAKSNGTENNKITLQDLESLAKIEVLKYPVSNGDITVSVIGNKLLLDKKVGDNYECICEIESVELLELRGDFDKELER